LRALYPGTDTIPGPQDTETHRVSQAKGPLIEKAFGWMQQTGGIRKARLRGRAEAGVLKS
jgi:hypothetical protein